MVSTEERANGKLWVEKLLETRTLTKVKETIIFLLVKCFPLYNSVKFWTIRSNGHGPSAFLLQSLPSQPFISIFIFKKSEIYLGNK
jgi:hypothetical protein